MHIKNETWKLSTLRRLKNRIDPKPQYQRGEVWNLAQRQLLIDSIINKFDIPKIYLRSRTSAEFAYEVADGQQRLLAVWKFFEDGYSLGEVRAPNSGVSGKRFSQLPPALKKQILDFEMTVSVVSDATNEDIRELFARLQKGVRLNPAELRNSTPSMLGDVVRAMAETHDFFRTTPRPNRRFEHDNLVAHAFAIELYGLGERDLKAPELAAMYEDHRSAVSTSAISRVNANLKFMARIQILSDQAIRTKWGFVDVYGAVSSTRGRQCTAKAFARRYRIFESKRLESMKEPQKLLATGRDVDKQMYDYISHFKTGGGTSEALRRRHNAIVALARRSGQ